MGKKKDIGTRFEDDTQECLTKFKRMQLLNFVRLYDTKSARNFLPAQPGDFIVASGRAHLLECKSSEKYRTLAEGQCLEDNVSAVQAAEHRLWAKAGNPCWFIFYSQPAGQVELWRGDVVGLAYAKKQTLGEPEVAVGINMLSELLQVMFIGPVKEIDFDNADLY